MKKLVLLLGLLIAGLSLYGQVERYDAVNYSVLSNNGEKWKNLEEVDFPILFDEEDGTLTIYSEDIMTITFYGKTEIVEEDGVKMYKMKGINNDGDPVQVEIHVSEDDSSLSQVYISYEDSNQHYRINVESVE